MEDDPNDMPESDLSVGSGQFLLRNVRGDLARGSAPGVGGEARPRVAVKGLTMKRSVFCFVEVGVS